MLIKLVPSVDQTLELGHIQTCDWGSAFPYLDPALFQQPNFYRNLPLVSDKVTSVLATPSGSSLHTPLSKSHGPSAPWAYFVFF